MNLEEFNIFLKERKVKEQELAKEINDCENQLSIKDKEYIEVLTKDGDLADKLYLEKTNLKNKIKILTDKYNILYGLNKKDIREKAKETVIHLKDIEKEYYSKADELGDKAESIEKELIKIFEQGFELESEYKSISSKYHSLLIAYGIERNEIPQIPPMFPTLPLFKNSKFDSLDSLKTLWENR